MSSLQRLKKYNPSDVREEIRREIARNSFLDFVRYTKPDFEVNWHHRTICEELDALMAGHTTRLILCTPPRHGKSELISRRFPAYVLGRDPDAEIIATSYGADLAARMNRDVQRIIDSEEYAAIFPGTRLFGANVRTVAQGSYLRNSDIFEVVGCRGVYRSAGVGGGITGMGAKYAIVDDPLKNREDANSVPIREKVWDWYASTFYTRLAPDARVLIIMTRWHEDDLVGRLLEGMKEEGAEPWRVISFPAFFEGEREDAHPDDKRGKGEPLWPNRYGSERLERIRKTIGSFEWAGLYQQRPAPEGGAIFKRHWLRFYNPGALAVEIRHSDRDFDEVVQAWDMTFKDADTSDYVVGQVWGRRGGNFYLLDQVRERMSFTETVHAVKMMSSKYPNAWTKLVEDKANGPAILSHLGNEVFGLNPIKADGSKESRAQAVTPLFESGNVYLPDPAMHPWVNDLTAELLSFPSAKHDDQVDALAYALRELAGGQNGMSAWLKLAELK